jgi:DNA-binding NtrC family response regulator
MTILYIDLNTLQRNIRISGLETHQHTVKIAETLDDVQSMFAKGRFEMVIIDHQIPDGMKIVKYIDDIDPKQPLLSVSASEICVHERCDDCLLNYNARRLNNPTTLSNINRMVQGFEVYECDHYNSATNHYDNNQKPAKN